MQFMINDIDDQRMFGLIDQWSATLIWTSGWNKEPLRCCFMRRMVSIGGDDEDDGDDEFQLPVSPYLQSDLRSRSLSLDDGREKIASCASRCCWARRRHSACNSATFRLESQVSGDGGQDRHDCRLEMQRRKTHDKCIQCICWRIIPNLNIYY